MSEVVGKLGITYDEVWRRHVQRGEADLAVSGYANLAYDESVSETYARLLAAEESIAPGEDYVCGSATYEDEVLAVKGLGSVLLTAEHATDQKRKKDMWKPKLVKAADYGTGGLTKVVAEDTGNPALIAIGRQSGDANHGKRSVLREAMTSVIETPANRAHFSIHMIDRGRATYPRDKRAYSVVLGVGDNPTEATLALAEEAQSIGVSLGLKTRDNATHLKFDKSDRLETRKGKPKRGAFRAAGNHTTRTHSQIIAERLGKEDYISMHFEINEALLVSQGNRLPYPTSTDRELGPTVGHLFMKLVIDAAGRI
jgi:hypothetical protein